MSIEKNRLRKVTAAVATVAALSTAAACGGKSTPKAVPSIRPSGLESTPPTTAVPSPATISSERQRIDTELEENVLTYLDPEAHYLASGRHLPAGVRVLRRDVAPKYISVTTRLSDGEIVDLDESFTTANPATQKIADLRIGLYAPGTAAKAVETRQSLAELHVFPDDIDGHQGWDATGAGASVTGSGTVEFSTQGDEISLPPNVVSDPAKALRLCLDAAHKFVQLLPTPQE